MHQPAAGHIWLNLGRTEDVAPMFAVLERLLEHRDPPGIVITSGRGVRVPRALPEGVTEAQRPYDLTQSVDRFLSERASKVAIMTASDLFPAALGACVKRNVPLILVQANGSERTARMNILADFRLGRRLRSFDKILVETEQDAEVYVRKGAARSHIAIVGKVEAPAVALPCDEGEREYLARLVATRPVFLAVNVPPEEVDAVETAFRAATRQSHRLLLIVVPSDLSTGVAMAASFEGRGWVVARREDGGEPDATVQVFVADAPDELGLWYRLSPVAFVGGTLTGKGSADPMHGAALGSALIHGDKTAGHDASFRTLRAAGATRAISAPEQLTNSIIDLLAPDRAAALSARAWDVASQGAEAADRAASEIREILHRGPS